MSPAAIKTKAVSLATMRTGLSVWVWGVRQMGAYVGGVG